MRACVEKVDVLGWNKSIVSRCAEAPFVLIRDDGEELVGGVGVFTYMGRPLEKSGKDWPAVRRNIRKVQQVWGRLGKLLRMEGGDPFVSDIFYRSVVQAVMLFWSKTLVLLAAITERLEGVYMVFLRKVMGKTAWKQWDRTWKRGGGRVFIGKHGLRLWVSISIVDIPR